jgi:hypothetical protein
VNIQGEEALTPASCSGDSGRTLKKVVSARPSPSKGFTQAPSALRIPSRRAKPRWAQLLLYMEIDSMGKGRVLGRMPDEGEVTKGDEAAR